MIQHATVTYGLIERVWRPLLREHEARLEAILMKWRGTRYVAGGTLPGAGVDCVRFVCLVLDEWLQRPSLAIEELPPDTAMHNRESAIGAMKEIVRRYEPADHVVDGTISPGDILVVGASGPGHAQIVGVQENTVWQSSAGKVHFTGLSLALGHQQLFAHYRIREAAAWSST